jgi:Pin2-interacting protein X1
VGRWYVLPSVAPKFFSDIRIDAARFGSNYLAKFGWDCSKGLGASGEGMTSHLKVSHKLDMLGIGAAHQRDPNGIAWKQNKDFENLLKRLNGEGAVEGFKKAEEVVEDCQGGEKEKKRKKKKEVGDEPRKKKRKKGTEKEESGLVESSIPVGASVTGALKSTSSLPRYRACVVFSIFLCYCFCPD